MRIIFKKQSTINSQITLGEGRTMDHCYKKNFCKMNNNNYVDQGPTIIFLRQHIYSSNMVFDI